MTNSSTFISKDLVDCDSVGNRGNVEALEMDAMAVSINVCGLDNATSPDRMDDNKILTEYRVSAAPTAHEK